MGPEASSSYGAVLPLSPLESDEEGQRQRGEGQAEQKLGCGARLYLGVLLLVTLSGLVRWRLARVRERAVAR